MYFFKKKKTNLYTWNISNWRCYKIWLLKNNIKILFEIYKYEKISRKISFKNK